MAGALGMLDVCAAVLKALAALEPSDVDDATLEDAVACFGTTKRVRNAEVDKRLQSLAKQVLLLRLGDVVAVMSSASLRAQWLRLPHGALIELLRSAELATDSEDSVVAAVSAWVAAQDAAPSKEQLAALAEELRLSQLSKAYLHRVVPLIGWLARCVTCAQLMLVALATPKVPPAPNSSWAGYSSSSGDPLRCSLFGSALNPEMPSAWLSASARPCSAASSSGVALEVEVSHGCLTASLLPQMPAAISMAPFAISEVPVQAEAFAHGMDLQLRLGLRKSIFSPAGELSAWLVVRHAACLDADPRVSAAVHLSYTLGTSGAGFARPPLRGQVNTTLKLCAAPPGYCLNQLHTFSEAQPITDPSAWASARLVDALRPLTVNLAIDKPQ